MQVGIWLLTYRKGNLQSCNFSWYSAKNSFRIFNTASDELDSGTSLNQEIVKVSLTGGVDQRAHYASARIASRKGVTRAFQNRDNAPVLGPDNPEAPTAYITDQSNAASPSDSCPAPPGEGVPVYVRTRNGDSNMKLAFEVQDYADSVLSQSVCICDKLQNKTHQLHRKEVYELPLPVNSDDLAGRFFVFFGKRPYFEKARTASNAGAAIRVVA